MARRIYVSIFLYHTERRASQRDYKEETFGLKSAMAKKQFDRFKYMDLLFENSRSGK